MQDELMPDQTQAMPAEQQTGKHAFGNTPELPSEAADATKPTEDEQQHYDMLINRAMNQMHGDGKTNIVKMLGTGNTPSEGMAQATALLLRGLMSSAKEAGVDIALGTAQAASVEIVELLNELGEASGVFEYTDDEAGDAEAKAEMKDAVVNSVKHYTDAMRNAGEITPEMEAEAKKQMQTNLAQEQGGQQDLGAAGQEDISPAPQQGGGLINSLMQNGV